MFRKLSAPNLTVEQQGLLYFLCQNYRDLSHPTRQRILTLCDAVAENREPDRRALLELLTTRRSTTAVSLRHRISESRLCRLRGRFYEAWFRQPPPPL